MKKLLRILAVLAAAATLGFGMLSCDYWEEDWYKDGGNSSSSSSSSDSSSGSASYAGNLSVNGNAYTSLTMNGTGSSGEAVLTGGSGSISGSYARAGVAAAANTVELSGSYTATFDFGTITLVFSGTTVTLSQGSVSASGTASLSSSTEPAISTLSGKTFVNSANSNDYIVGLSDSTIEWHNPPSRIVDMLDMLPEDPANPGVHTSTLGSVTVTYNSSTGIFSGCTYEICRAGESPTSVSASVSAYPVPYIFINYALCYEQFTIESATAIKSGPGDMYVQQ